MIDSNFTFTNGSMCQHRVSGNITTGINTRMGSPHMLIHLHTVALQFNVQFIQTDLGQVSFPTHTDEYLFGFDKCSLTFLFNSDTLFADFNYFGIQMEINPTLLIFRTQHTTGFLIHDSQYLRHHLDNMHFHSHTVEERSKLHSYDSTTYNNQRFRKFFDLQSLF